MSDETTHREDLVLERTLEASLDLVWRMWVEPDDFATWYGPDGVTVTVAQMDVRVGGTRLVGMAMQSPRGPREIWFVGEYREVVPSRLLVYTESMADSDGNVLSPADVGMPDGHPVTTEVRVALEDLGGRTRMTLTHLGVPAGSPGASGWAMALDKLASRLSA